MYSQKVPASSATDDDDFELKRSELNSRGYYSEIITKVDYGPDVDAEGLAGCQKKPNFLWQIRTEKHAPTIKKLPPAEKKLNLKDAERWMTYDEDDSIEFSVDTFKPKVQLQLRVYPFEITRSVATERLRRQFQAKSIRILLDELNIQPSDMISLQLLKQYLTGKVPKLNTTTNYLPLELFDDEEYDCRTPENWLELGLIKGVRNPLPAEAFIPVEEYKLDNIKNFDELFNNLCEWVNVAVMDYNPGTKLWKVLTLDGTRRIAELPRIYIMFKAEDPSIFAQRIKAAVDLRKHTETTLR
ncbi:hypothetical protein BDFB_001449 [Asbolus verrucosus]|uniref:Uncharacterized protein n=1 Tax=Asbolus verrucosus TaxID=1661398 RepID=A0A482VAY1_ASBVE|nr:hypothetical protein BDFB_001449 [Asbolus verrucosus]